MSRFYDAFDRPERAIATVTPITRAEGEGDAYGLRALESECELVAQAQPGQRNDTLNRAAFRMGRLVAGGHLDTTTATTALRDAAKRSGLPDHEISLVLRDTSTAALTTGQDLPRDPATPLIESTVTEVDPDQLRQTPGPDTASDVAADGQDGNTPGRERTSWWPEPIDLVADRTAATPLPDILTRDDQHSLLYRGKINTLLGESESGKSWLALLAAQQALAGGEHVLYLDFEDNAATIRDRLHLLGTLPDDLTRLDYAHPDQALDMIAAEDLQEAITAGYQVIVVDGVNYAMGLLGLDLNSNTDANTFTQRILRPLAATGAGVITVDHVPKNVDQRGKGAIGAQSKRAMLDGCGIRVEVDQPFGRGQSGTLKLWVDKDRTGHVRGISKGGKYAGTAYIDSSEDRVRIRIEADDTPHDDGSGWQPTYLMEQVSRLLEDIEEASGRTIEQGVKGRASNVRDAITELVDGGWVERVKREGRGGGLAYRFVGPYREGDRAPESKCVQVRPKCVPDALGGRSGSASHPYGDGTAGTHFPDPDSPAGNRDALPACRRCGEVNDDLRSGYCPTCATDLGR